MRKVVRRIRSVFFILIIPVLAVSNDPGEGWNAGTAKIKITPRQHMWLAGYASRTKPSEGVIHDLWAKALFLEDPKGNTAMLVTTDLLGFSKELSDTIRNRLKDQCGLTKAQVILNSSHTHSGPVLTNSLRMIYSLDSVEELKIERYSAWLADQILVLAKKARKAAHPVNIYTGNGVVRFQVNRRNNSEKKIRELTELKGPNDFAVPVLKIESKKGQTETIVFGYACHPTVLNGYEWSGDYPGFAQLELEERFKGATAMFFQGAGADQNPLPRRSLSLATQYGRELAASVEQVLTEKMTKLEPVLKTAYTEVSLELNGPPPAEELIEIVKHTDGFKKIWAEGLLEKMRAGIPVKTSYPYPVQFWQLGGQSIVSLGGELLVDYSIKLKRIFGQDTFVMGYSNDMMAYIPGDQVLQEGGYEGESSQIEYELPSTWKAGIERKILKAVIELAIQTGKVLDGEEEEVVKGTIEFASEQTILNKSGRNAE